jgi:2-polyprenyl-3-methyl-5-hydroxy-6-metoxy-1,4-benzoquinol methylase
VPDVSLAPLKETEIRPDHLMAGQAERFAADIRRLLAHREEFVEVGCPACASRDGRKAFEKYDLEYRVCEACETMYVSPRPPPAVLDMYYSTSENYAYWNKYIFPASEEARREKIFRPRAERILDICRRHGVATRLLLEVGAGFGTFCQEMQRTGVFSRVIAVEPTPDLAQTCRERGLEVIERPIEHIPAEELGQPDLIACFEVVEHLFSPIEFVTRCFELLAPGGLFVASCPSTKGFDVVVLGSRSDTVDVEHINYFHPRSLQNLLTRTGFEVVEVVTPGLLDAELVRKKALAGEVQLDAFLKQVLLDDWERLGHRFQAFLAENGLSSHLWIVGRKPAAGA